MSDIIGVFGIEAKDLPFFALLAGCIVVEISAWFNAGYRDALRKWMAFEDPLGSTIWTRFWPVRVTQLLLMAVSVCFI